MKDLNDMTDEELTTFVKDEKVKGTTMESLLDLVQCQIDSLYKKVYLYQFIRLVYKSES